MAIFVAAAGTAFQAENFGTFWSGFFESPAVQQIEGALNWATAALDSLRLFQSLWYDADTNGVNQPREGDYLMGRVDYDVILPVPSLQAEGGVTYSGVTTARFTDMVAHAFVGTLTLAPYDVTISALSRGGITAYAVSYFNPVYALFSGDDTVTLGDMADNFYDPTGVLVIDLGGGNDTLVASGLGADTAHGGAGDDQMSFGAGGVFYGDDGNDTIYAGGSENDGAPSTLVGGAGDDDLQGFFGNDLFIEGAGSGDDVLDGSYGQDTVDYSGVATAVDVDLGYFPMGRPLPEFYTGIASGGSGEDYLISVENAIGSGFDDRLRGDFFANSLHGGDGNDVLEGGDGGDGLDGGAGIDTASYAGAYYGVTVDLTAGTTARGEAAGDVLSGIENLIGGYGNDKFTGDALANVLDGGPDGRDTLNGMDGDDVLRGFARADRLVAGLGDDRLIGGEGADVLLGGMGNDRFIFTSQADSTALARDTILDFGDQDRIDLRALDAVPVTELLNDAFVLTVRHGAGGFSGTQGEIRLVATLGGTEIRLDLSGDGVSDMEIFVKGITDLSARDFLL